jgi:hypothetical protein
MPRDVGGSAGVAGPVVGHSPGFRYSQAAFAGKADDETLNACNTALHDEPLDRRDEAGIHVNRGVLYMLLHNYLAGARTSTPPSRSCPTSARRG